MADQESILDGSGGLNFDDSSLNNGPGDQVSRFQTGDVRYRLNCRAGSATEANVGSNENIPSTLEVNTYVIFNGTAWISGTPPAGTNKALGRCEDIKEGRVYWPVYNSNGNHLILVWVKQEKKIYELLRWSGLNFNSQSLVSMCRISFYLIFCDGLESFSNPPRVICSGNTDITKDVYSLKFTLGSNFSEYHISFAKWPPLAPPVPFYGFDGVNININLAKGLFQFAYRYVFYGGFRSTWSPPSWWVSAQFEPVNITQIGLRVPGFTFDYTTPANTAFPNSDIRFYEVVEFIEFGYHESATDPWKLYKRLPVSLAPVPEVPVYFNNNGPAAVIAQTDIGQYFDSVPFLSKACEAIDNRPMLGYNKDDLPAPDFAVTNVEIYSVNPSNPNWLSPGALFVGLSGSEQVIFETMTDIRRYSFKERGVYNLGVIFQHFAGRTGLVKTNDDLTFVIPIGPSDNTSGSEQYHALGFKIDPAILPPIDAVAYQIVRSNCLNIDFFVEGYINTFKFLQTTDNAIQDWLKTPDEIKTIQNDFYNATGPTASLPLSNRILSAIRKTVEVVGVNKSGYIYMDISNWVLSNVKTTTTTDQYPTNNLFYNFQEGDRVVFLGSSTVAFPAPADLIQYDEEIIEFTGQGILIKKPISLVGLVPRSQAYAAIDNMYKIEIYRPKKFAADETVIFYEMGEWYPITQPMTANRDFSKRDFTWTDPASVTVSFVAGNRIYNKMPISVGDVHMVKKDFYFKPVPTFYLNGHTGVISVAQMNQDKDNAGGVWEHNDGRPLISYQYPPQQLIKTTQVRFGGKFLEDSIFIAINTFLDSNQYIYPLEYGAIRALVNTSNTQVESVGNILLAIGEDQAWSIYVNRVTIQDLAGRTQVGLSDKVLGSYNTLLGGHGTLNGESVSKNNGRVIWWNVKKGTWVRYSRDGLTAISQLYNMKNWFNDLAGLIIDQYGTAENPRALSVQDNYHDTWITTINHSTLPSTFKGYPSYKCAEFHESQDEWKTIFDYMPDVFARLDNDVYSIIGCTVHIHEEGADFGSFYGVKKDSAIQFISNQQPRSNKIWNYLSEQSTDKWSFPVIKGDFKSNGATIQQTQILLANLVTKENLFWTDLLRDQNSVNKAPAIVEGNLMRGRSLDLYMQLDSSVNWLSVFNYLVVGYTDSPKNVKK